MPFFAGSLSIEPLRCRRALRSGPLWVRSGSALRAQHLLERGRCGLAAAGEEVPVDTPDQPKGLARASPAPSSPPRLNAATRHFQAATANAPLIEMFHP